MDENGKERTEHWEAYTDAYNYKYLYSRENEAVAYYTCDNTMFYFTAYYGNKNSLLYYFYLTAYKVLLADTEEKVTDVLPLNMIKNYQFKSWLNDLIAPFKNYLKVEYSSSIESMDNIFDTTLVKLKSDITICGIKKKRKYCSNTITVRNGIIAEFIFENEKTKIVAKCAF